MRRKDQVALETLPTEMNSIFKQLNEALVTDTANAISCDLSQVLLRENVAESERPGHFIVHVYVDQYARSDGSAWILSVTRRTGTDTIYKPKIRLRNYN